MIKKFLASLFFLFLIAGQAPAGSSVESTLEYTGRDWTAWNEAQKETFITGYIAGTNNVIWEGIRNARQGSADGEAVIARYLTRLSRDRTKGLDYREAVELVEAAEARAAGKVKESLMGLVVYNTSDGRLLKAIDDLYSDRQNLGIKLTDAIHIVGRKLAGAPPGMISRMIEEKRRQRGRTIFVSGSGQEVFSSR